MGSTPTSNLRFVLADVGHEREVAATVEAAEATVADVLEAAGVEPPSEVLVDHRRVPTDHTLSEAAIPTGATIRPPNGSGGPLGAGPPSPVLRLAVAVGTGTSSSQPLDRAVTIGRDRDCDLVLDAGTVSGRHCRVEPDGAAGLVVHDLDSTNGTWVDGHAVTADGAPADAGALLRLGAVVLRVEAPPPDDVLRGMDPVRHLGPGGTLPFNRPPRPGASPGVAPLAAPEEASTSARKPTFNAAALIAPILLGGVMALALGPRYALFMLLSPVMLLSNYISGRRRARKEDRAGRVANTEELARFERELADSAAAERTRRWEQLPSLGEVARRAEQPSTRLWERRRGHHDVLQLAAGVGTVPWDPPLEGSGGGGPGGGVKLPGDAADALDRWRRVPRCPVPVELADGGVVGIVGDRDQVVALARSLLVQACVHHGPADLPVAVVADEAAVDDWSWATWLPHVQGEDGMRRLAGDGQQARALLAALRERDADEQAAPLLLVVDALVQLRGRDADARAVLRGRGGPVAGIVLAPTSDQLPAVCDTVIRVSGPEGEGRLVRPAQRLVVDDLLAAGLDTGTCLRLARRLARFEDPEMGRSGADLPSRVDLLDLLGVDPVCRDGVPAAWKRTRGSPDLATPIGRARVGQVDLDLVADGPHMLLGGTTGSGKSELLRSLVAGLAATHDPDHCTFVLVDYKGGAAFDACGDLPHVVGLVTDLDEHLGERALRCLEAELVHREKRLRTAGVSDLPGWLRLPAEVRGDPLPRLVVVIDEFATLKAELPDFVDALVGVAQRGRSLGVHLVLGTQRPSGAVDANVRANANLRVALRMTDDHDSTDVIGVKDAAAIPPSRPGRGLLRSGPGEPVLLQTALVTGHGDVAPGGVRIGPVTFGPEDLLPEAEEVDRDDRDRDLDRLVAACRTAFDEAGGSPPREPWPAPLPEHHDLVQLQQAVADAPEPVAGIPLGLLDEPDHQRQVPAGWDPDRGNLLVYGMVGSGTTTTLRTVALSAAATYSPDDLHLHVLDLGAGELVGLAELPHCGAVVTAREPDRRQRLRAWLLAEAERRRGLSHAELSAEPRQVVMVDGLDTWFDDLDEPTSYDAVEAVQRLVLEAPQLGMAVVGSARRAGALRVAVTAAVEQRLVHRLADPNDLSTFGLRPKEVPVLPPGRAARPSDGLLLQVATPGDPAAAVADIRERWPDPVRPAAPVAELPGAVTTTDVAAAAAAGVGAWQVPVGLDVTALEPVVWTLHTGVHALVLGPPSSGRTSLLAGVAAAMSRQVRVLAVGELPGVDDVVGVGEWHQALAEAADGDEPTLVLVDDAERIEDPGVVWEALRSADSVRLVVAARADVIQGEYGHWARKQVGRSRTGAFLRPTGDVPGDLLGVRLPRRTPVAAMPGRGWVVDGGEVTFGQLLGPID